MLGMNLFTFATSGSNGFEVSHQFWIFVALTVPLTLLTVGSWLLMSRRRRRVREAIKDPERWTYQEEDLFLRCALRYCFASLSITLKVPCLKYTTTGTDQREISSTCPFMCPTTIVNLCEVDALTATAELFSFSSYFFFNLCTLTISSIFDVIEEIHTSCFLMKISTSPFGAMAMAFRSENFFLLGYKACSGVLMIEI